MVQAGRIGGDGARVNGDGGGEGEGIVRPGGDPVELVPAAGRIGATIRAQDDDAEAFALAFIGKLLRLRGVRIDREHFLTAELRRRRVARTSSREPSPTAPPLPAWQPRRSTT